MNIDFSKMNEGDKVKFLCGGEATIEKIYGKGNYHGDYKIKFLGYIGKWIYMPSGRTDPEAVSLWDIVEIIAKPFDWNNVKPGDAFCHKELAKGDEGYHPNHCKFNGKLMRWVAISPSTKGDIFEIDHNCDLSNISINWLPRRENLIYKPEYNLPLP